MREIKFRAWDTAHGMVYQPAFGSMGEGNVVLLNELLAVPEQVKLMQYTGLKDKNGKEIYEGDIVQARLATEFNSYAPNIAVVFFNNERAEFALEIKDDTQHQWSIHDGCEVIGNIYEHAELLTK